MAIARLATPAETRLAVDRLKTQDGSALFVFFGAEDPLTGQSWCPDCVTADPVLRRACATLRPDLTLYECPVGQRSEWKNHPEHPYRTDPNLRLQRIPTLIFFADGCERGRLVEGDCSLTDVVAAFLTR